MRSLASILAMTLLTTSWVTCAGTLGAAPMVCCAKVQHDCPKMEQLKICCPERQQPNPDAGTARLEPVTSLIVPFDAGLLAHAALVAITPASLGVQQTFIDFSPPTRHSIDCILLI